MVLTKEQLVQALLDMAKAIEHGDSFEGNLTYSCMENHCYINEFEVNYVYRVGNFDGQGGMCMLLETPPEEIAEREQVIRARSPSSTNPQ